MKKTVLFYLDAHGRNPVADFIKSLPPDESEKCHDYIAYLRNYGEEIRRPIGDYVGSKLYELRPKQSRVLYFFMLKDYAVLVHAFRKDSSAIPKREIRTALDNMHDFINRYNKGLIYLEECK